MIKNLKYPNLIILFGVIFLTVIFYNFGFLDSWVKSLENLGYLGAFILGMVFVSSFTVVPSAAMLVLMSQDMNILAVSLFAGLGGMAGDYLIFRFVKDELADELREIFRMVSGNGFSKFKNIIHTGYFAWLGPVIGAAIIASPFPDELGVGLLGIYKLDNKRFMAITLVLDTIGIFLLLSASRAIF